MEENGARGSTRRLRSDEGAAMVEMSIAGVLVILLLLGVLMFGYLMSFRQNMTQAAAEGVRAGAVAADPVVAATGASNQALDSFLQNGCSHTGMSCNITVLPACPAQPARKCIQVELVYDYAAHPFLPDVPLMSSFFPDTIESTSVAEINQ